MDNKDLLNACLTRLQIGAYDAMVERRKRLDEMLPPEIRELREIKKLITDLYFRS